MTDSLKAFFVARSIPWQAYGLPNDGRQGKHLCQLRRTLVIQYAGFANPDGSSIRAGLPTIVSEMGISKRTLNRLNLDLKMLGVLNDDGWHRVGEKKHVRLRSLNLEALAALKGKVAPSASAIYTGR